MSKDSSGRHIGEWVRNTTTGDRGQVVEDDGRRMVRLDRGPNVKILRPWPTKGRESGDWKLDGEPGALLETQIGMISWVADQALCEALRIGESQPNMTWYALRGDERMAWIRNGPIKTKVRISLYNAIRNALDEATRA